LGGFVEAWGHRGGRKTARGDARLGADLLACPALSALLDLLDHRLRRAAICAAGMIDRAISPSLRTVPINPFPNGPRADAERLGVHRRRALLCEFCNAAEFFWNSHSTGQIF
jgi:hypothetical protein